MAETLEQVMNNKFEEVNTNVYKLTIDNNKQLQWVNKFLQPAIINEKINFVESGKELTENDLYMVRSMGEIPNDLTYQSATNRGDYTNISNPFDSVLPFMSDKTDMKLVCPIYRDTVHFSINGLVSNLWYTQGFTNRETVIIEPLENHMNEKLINLNPVDTMIDVGKSDEPIKDNAIYIFSEEVYNSLPEEQKKKVENGKVYIFDIKDTQSYDSNTQTPPLQIITDLVMCHNNILPQHTINQSILREETYTDEDWTKNYPNTITYSDKDYLKQFTDLIENINQEKFGISYYNVPESVKERREAKKDNPGIGHYDAKYWDEEIINNNRLQKEVFARYVDFLSDKTNIPQDILDEAKKIQFEYIDKTISLESYGDYISLYPPGLYYKYEDRVKEVLTPEELINLTKEFNQLELSKIKNTTKQHELDSMFEETKSETNELDAMFEEKPEEIENTTYTK